MNENNEQKMDKPFRMYSLSPLFYWWPVWLVGFSMAGFTFWAGQYAMFVPQAIEVRRNLELDPEQPPQDALVWPAEQSIPEPPSGYRSPYEAPHIHLSSYKFPGFLFCVAALFVLIHSSVLMRGFRSYFFLLLGVILLLVISLVDVLYPESDTWYWVRHVVYYLPDIHLSADTYLFLSSIIFVAWLVVYRIYDRLTYMEFSESQVQVLQEIGEGETVYDASTMTVEKKKDDFFRHYILGFGFLKSLGLGWLSSGTGDLVFHTGGSNPEVIHWPNVMNVDAELDRLEKSLRSRQVVQV